MFSQERIQTILKLLAKHQRLTSKQLEEALGASPATVRRDLADMEAQGLAVRVHGGIIHPGLMRGEQTFASRSRQARAAKTAIAQAASQLVPEGATVFVDSGTTLLEAGRRLLVRGDLTLVTNSIELVHASHGAEARVICIGGQLKPVSMALVSEIALLWLEQLRFDVALLGASGLSADQGPSASALDEAGLKRAVVGRAARSILLADSGKWEKPSTACFAPWNAFETWVCDGGLPPRAATAVRAQGVKVKLTE